MLEKTATKIDKIGNVLVDAFHTLGLFIIGATIVWSAIAAYMEMLGHGYASLKDILLLFIYLELGAMVGIYFKTHRLPVRFLIYIAITALTRLLTIDIKTMPDQHILTITGAILILTIAILILRVGSTRFQVRDSED